MSAPNRSGAPPASQPRQQQQPPQQHATTAQVRGSIIGGQTMQPQTSAGNVQQHHPQSQPQQHMPANPGAAAPQPKMEPVASVPAGTQLTRPPAGPVLGQYPTPGTAASTAGAQHRSTPSHAVVSTPASAPPTSAVSTASKSATRSSNPYSHNISRTAPATVVWLHENFEACEDVSLGREPLYKHYISHCKELGQDPVNQASFGKLIRSVFPNLKTRRLGTRGNSKYHYYGIRVKQTSKLHFDKSQIGGAHHRFRGKSSQKPKKKASSATGGKDGAPHAAEMLKFCNTRVELPVFPSMVSQGFSAKEDFSKPYHANCKEVLRAIAAGEFDRVAQIWNQFWGSIAAHFKTVLGTEEGLRTVMRCDDIFHCTVKKMLVGDVLQPLPEHLLKQIRFFGKRLEPWMKTALEGLPPRLVEAKVDKIKRLANLLRRYTSLNHLSNAFKKVLDDHRDVQAMVNDLKCISFESIELQCGMLSWCKRLNPRRVMETFERQLAARPPMGTWASWLQQLIWEEIKDSRYPLTEARAFLRVWTSFCSALMRDLTLRSAESFGSYHLCRLVFDEILFFLLERAEDMGISCLQPENLRFALNPGLDFDRQLTSNGQGVAMQQPHSQQQQQQQQQQARYSVQTSGASQQQQQTPQQQHNQASPMRPPMLLEQSSSMHAQQQGVSMGASTQMATTTTTTTATTASGSLAAGVHAGMPAPATPPGMMLDSSLSPGFGLGSSAMDPAFAFGSPSNLQLTPPAMYMQHSGSHEDMLGSPVPFDKSLADSPFKTSTTFSPMGPPRPPDESS